MLVLKMFISHDPKTPTAQDATQTVVSRVPRPSNGLTEKYEECEKRMSCIGLIRNNPLTPVVK